MRGESERKRGRGRGRRRGRKRKKERERGRGEEGQRVRGSRRRGREEVAEIYQSKNSKETDRQYQNYNYDINLTSITGTKIFSQKIFSSLYLRSSMAVR